jgi:hypothetical protein
LIYPNPASDRLNLEISDKASELVSVQIISVLGEVVWSGTGEQPGRLTIDISNFKPGLYIVTTSNTTHPVTSRFVKM